MLRLIATDPDRQEAARKLVSRGAEVDAKDDAGMTPLHVAASMDNTQGVDLLIEEAGANMNVDRMASKGKFDDLLNHMGNQVDACLAKALPQKFRDIVECLRGKAHVIAKDSIGSAVQADDINKFRDLLKKTTKKLTKLAKAPKRTPDSTLLDSLQTSWKDMKDLHFRMKNQDDSSFTVAHMFSNSGARKFWCDSFGDKVCILYIE